MSAFTDFFSNLGKKIKSGVSDLGKKISSGLSTAWNGVKTAANWVVDKTGPVGALAKKVFEYSPLGATTRLIDSGIKVGTNLLNGDVKGAGRAVLTGARDYVNQPALADLLPGGSAVKGVLENVVKLGGQSVSDLKSRANQALDVGDALLG